MGSEERRREYAAEVRVVAVEENGKSAVDGESEILEVFGMEGEERQSGWWKKVIETKGC
jgi:hypothetical protein